MRYFEAAKVILAVWKVMIVLLEMQKIVFSFVKFIQGVYKRPNAFTDRLWRSKAVKYVFAANTY